jgi:hypothetical protein
VASLVSGGQTLTWTYGGGSFDSAFLLIALDPSTFTYSGATILTNFIILNVQALPANGLGSFGITIPTGLSFVSVWSEIVDMQDGTGAVLGATPIVSTLIPF